MFECEICDRTFNNKMISEKHIMIRHIQQYYLNVMIVVKFCEDKTRWGGINRWFKDLSNSYSMVLESNALDKFHGAMICTCKEVIEHASYEFLPGSRRKVKNNLPGDELVVEICLENKSICLLINGVWTWIPWIDEQNTVLFQGWTPPECHRCPSARWRCSLIAGYFIYSTDAIFWTHLLAGTVWSKCQPWLLKWS